MRQSELQSRVKTRLIALLVFGLLAAFLSLYPRGLQTTAEAQRRRPQTPRRPTTTQPAAAPAASGARRYSRFQHADHIPREGRRTRVEAENLQCTDCHKIPSAKPFTDSPNDPLAKTEDVAAATKPSAEGYPYHDSCVRCHRPEFFKGATPLICTVCHTSSGPRLTARNMLAFPKQSKQAVTREFPGYFPHALHQGVIARSESPRLFDNGLTFVRATFNSPADTPQGVENCATCHVTDKRAPEAINIGGAEKSFTPPAGTFKTSPLGHASCFNCHWESQKPTREDCAGCHLTPEEVAKKKRAASADAPLPGLNSPKAPDWFKSWPQDWPKRLSLKFNHESQEVKEKPNGEKEIIKHHDFGCTTCHINITQMETLNIPKADVPITTCTQCHLQDTSKTSLKKEMFARQKDPKFVCAGCHTSIIGSQPPKCSHYEVLGQQCKP